MTGVEVRELHRIEELEAAARLFDGIWQPGAGTSTMPIELMRALSHAGNYVAGAFEGSHLVGASVAFLGMPAGEVLHSHVTGAAQGHGIGLALKHHQREWALARGLNRITWTFDPLIRRNAHFNLAKLGARPEGYLENFYGSMGDAINAGDETDRLFIVWHLGEAGPSHVDVPAGAVIGLSERDGRPVLGSIEGAVVLVATPEDAEDLRRGDPGAARAWRLAMREVLGGLMAKGGRVAGFHHKMWYVVERTAS